MEIDYGWLGAKLQEPLWYQDVAPLIKEFMALHRTNLEEYRRINKTLYCFFEEKLAAGEIALGNEYGIWDKERMPIDTVVIHHTGSVPGMSRERLSAIELIRLYAPYYAKPEEADKPVVADKPISSGHVRASGQVFWPYHWMVLENSGVRQLLNDREVGWQAGDWKMNCRSVAICFDGNFENGRPSNDQLHAAAYIIRQFYSHVPRENIIGHLEVKPERDLSCPSLNFLSSPGRRGWKEDLLELVGQ